MGLLRDHFTSELGMLALAFQNADKDRSGGLSAGELNLMMCEMGFDISMSQASSIYPNHDPSSA